MQWETVSIQPVRIVSIAEYCILPTWYDDMTRLVGILTKRLRVTVEPLLSEPWINELIGHLIRYKQGIMQCSEQ